MNVIFFSFSKRSMQTIGLHQLLKSSSNTVTILTVILEAFKTLVHYDIRTTLILQCVIIND